MADFIVALDCMGGDNAPEEPVKGAIDALKKDKELRVILVGDERAPGKGNLQEEGFVSGSGDEACEGRKGRCFRIRW